MLEVFSKEQTPQSEWKTLQSFLSRSDVVRYNILVWAFMKLPGYVNNRAWAGLEIYSINKQHCMELVGLLVSSEDPDDRDTALTVVRNINDVNYFDIVKPLLYDSVPYIQLDAVELLKDVFQEEAHNALAKLLQHDELWVRESAYEISKQ